MHNYITDSFFFEPGLKVRKEVVYKFYFRSESY